MTTYGVTPSGFVTKTNDVILSEIEAAITASPIIGAHRQDVDSVFGQFNRIFSIQAAELWEVAQDIYTSRTLAARGLALDDLCNRVQLFRLPPAHSNVDVLLTGTPGTTIPTNITVQNSNNSSLWVYTGSPINIPGGGTLTLNFTSVDYGYIIGVAGTINKIVTAVSGLASVTNSADATIGRLVETDNEFFIRFLQARSGLGLATPAAIRNHILQDLSGQVAWCAVYFNNTDSTDVNGVSPHSVHVVADCQSSVEQVLAQKIFDCVAAGIGTSGANSKIVQDSLGNSYTVNYDKPVDKYAHINLVLSLNTKVPFPSNGIDLIAAAIMSYYADPTNPSKISIGDSLLVGTLNVPVYSVPGVLDITTRQVASTDHPGDSPSYGTTDLVGGSTTRYNFDLSRIHISAS
jgi:uncharacterized phage protein gp47/JayE